MNPYEDLWRWEHIKYSISQNRDDKTPPIFTHDDKTLISHSTQGDSFKVKSSKNLPIYGGACEHAFMCLCVLFIKN
jgi:hypothetical protein